MLVIRIERLKSHANNIIEHATAICTNHSDALKAIKTR